MVNVSKGAVDKYLSRKAVDKSASVDVHLSTLKVIPSVIENSIVGEIHDEKKGDRNLRDIVRLYGCVAIDGTPYRVKSTIKRYVNNSDKTKAYSYEVTKIELLEGEHGDGISELPHSSSNSISATKLLKNTDIEEKNVSEDAEYREEEGIAEGGTTYEEGLRNARRAGYTKKQHDAYLERTERNARKRVADTIEKLNLTGRSTVVDSIDDLEGLTQEQRESRKNKKGWYDPRTGEVVVVLLNNESVEDAVAHKGLRELVGEERYDEFLDEVYSHLNAALKERVDTAAAKMFYNDLFDRPSSASLEKSRRMAVDV